MNCMLRTVLSRLSLASLVCIAVPGRAAESGAPIDGYAPVSVSSANYRLTPREVILDRVEAKSTINPPPVVPSAPTAEVHYVFLPGEIFENDMAYVDVCEAVAASLRKRGYVHAVDRAGRIRDVSKVTLVLRLSYGVRPWRRPLVRTESLAWADGIEARPSGRGLHTLGGEKIFDNRSGGDDRALAAAVENASNTSSIWGGGGGGGASSTAVPATVQSGALAADALNAYESTRDFNLVVVDAFDYAELKQKGRHAQRLWSTFVSAPREKDKPFSSVLGAMMRIALPYWAETTSGLQIVRDARAEVKIGESVVVPDASPHTPGKPE